MEIPHHRDHLGAGQYRGPEERSTTEPKRKTRSAGTTTLRTSLVLVLVFFSHISVMDFRHVYCFSCTLILGRIIFLG